MLTSTQVFFPCYWKIIIARRSRPVDEYTIKPDFVNKVQCKRKCKREPQKRSGMNDIKRYTKIILQNLKWAKYRHTSFEWIFVSFF